MKYFIKTIILISVLFLLQNCATIIGGSKYYAHVQTNNSPTASIIYKGNTKGFGSATFKVKRNEINRFFVNVKQENCDEQSFNFTGRIFRGGAFVGTILGWTGLVNGIPIPWGLGVDLATGALWKPDVNQSGVTKTDFRHFNYFIDYTGCNTKGPSKPN